MLFVWRAGLTHFAVGLTPFFRVAPSEFTAGLLKFVLGAGGEQGGLWLGAGAFCR